MEKRLMTFIACLFLSLGMALAQTQVSGKVTSAEDGEPVIGASIKVVGTKTGAVTDINGNFSLNAPAGAKLEISYIGMNSQTVKAASNMKIVMNPDNKALDEVIVVAYGTAKKSAFTGSAAVMKTEDIAKVADSNPVQALTGKVSGVQINTQTGQPGVENFKIRIRGISSINAGSTPLVIVDGSPWDGDMNDINPNDIASMTVLKDAASAALYGARGANGVVIITTKTGKEGSSSITVDAKWGSNSRATQDYKYVKSPAKYYETWYKGLYNYAKAQGMGNESAVAWANENLCSDSDYGLGYNVYTVPDGQYLIGSNGRINPNATLGRVYNYKGQDFMITPDDWTDATYQNSLRQEYAITATGSTDKSSFYGSANYLSNDGITKASNYKRFTGRLKADFQLRPWLKMGGNFSYSHANTNYLSTDDDGAAGSSGNVFALTTVAPIYPLYVRDGKGNILYNSEAKLNVYDYGDGEVNGMIRPYISQANPLSSNQLDTHNQESNTFNAVGFAEIRFLNDFKFTSTNSVMDSEARSTLTTNPYYGQYAASNGQVTKAHTRRWSYNYQQLLDWHHAFDKHDVDIMLGHEYYRTRYQSLDAYKTNMYSFDIPELSAAVNAGSADSYSDDYNTEGWFGRVQYNYAEKYFGSVSYRRDASSRFAPENRWGNFWSFGAAWLISKEKFFNVSWIDELKLKASYGEQGNDNIQDPVYGWDRYLYQNTYDVVNSNGQPSLVPKAMGNRDITWEKGGNFNAGIDFSLFRSRLTGSIEYFYRKTTDMLFYFPLPTSFGYGGYYANIGDMRNSGFEFTFDGTIIKTKDLTWGINLNLTTYGNKITRLPEERKTATVDGIRGYASGNYFIGEGKALYNWYMPKYAGVDPETGVALYWKDVKDANGNVTGEEKTDKYSEATEHLCGTALAPVYGGFGTNLTWKGLDVSVNFTYQIGGKVYDSTYASAMKLDNGHIFHADILNAWSEDNKGSNIPRIQFNDTYTASQSDRFLTNASYLTLQDFTIGYSLPKQLIQSIGLTKVRLYVQGNNLWLWSKRQGLDPRQSISGETTAAYYSPIRTISGGVSVSF